MNRLTFFAIVHLFLKGHTMLGNRASDEVGKSYTGVPGVDLCAEERNGRRQMLDEKRKNKTRDAEAVPGLIAEPTGTDGFRALCHQFSLSSLPRQESCLTGCNACWLRRKQLVLPWDMVDNSTNPCKRIFGWFSPHSTARTGYFIL